MEVMAGGGSTFSIEDSEEHGSDLPTTMRRVKASSSSSSFDTVNDEGAGLSRVGSGIWSGQTADYSSESSSIGTPGDSEEEDEESEEDDDGKELGLRGLASMSSLEDSLPNKGLSNHYKGKSKSFGNLGEIGSVKEVPKQENPLNKRRRLQICNKLARRSFYSWQNPKSMPLLPVNEDQDDDEEEGDDGDLSDEERGGTRGVVVARNSSFKNRAFKSRSCFALSDLQEEEDE
ncbi:KID-containing protein 1-like isoform X2 [Raphanus sativus]|uniref:KID-containing protein 1-like isoform X2 n=1 Tax=Raphanus sativus TaxID=3726 RepID=A0A6J0KXC1_RAPSA|nr:KID-containing protein 1-like isoform X2 [Raphanus sativus]